MRARTLRLLLALLAASPAALAQDANAAPSSMAVLEGIQRCAALPGEEGERLSQQGIAILQSGDGRFDDALRSIEQGKEALERAMACFTLDPQSDQALTEQDREFLVAVRDTMREGLDRMGALLPTATSHQVVVDYLDRCRKPRAREASALYEKALAIRERKTGTAAEVEALLAASAKKAGEIAACADSLEPLTDRLGGETRKAVERTAKIAREQQARADAAR